MGHSGAMTLDVTELGLLDDEEIELDLAALALSALDHEGVDLDRYLELLDDIEDSLAEAGEDALAPTAQGEALARVFAGEFGFTGDTESYDAPLNADLIRVLDRRRGLPVSLSLLYVAIARRLGWAAFVLNTPGQVLVRIGTEPFVILDPFNRGRLVDDRQLRMLVEQFVGPGAPLRPEYLAPATNRTVLIRLLQNQASRALAAADAGRAEALYERMSQFAPGYPDVWWQLAGMQMHRKDYPSVRRSLSAMLEVTLDPERRKQITAALAAVPMGNP